MGSPEVPRLRRRLEEQDDTIRALSDTVLDIKDTVDGHTRTLAEQSRLLGQIQTTQAQQGELLAEILRRLPG
jgi:septal ring factor EnvC (AmiA/AmiB activator)